MTGPLTDTQERDLDRLVSALHGTSDSPAGKVETLELAALTHLAEDELEDLIADDLERCQGCGWWHEPGHLTHDNDADDGRCDDCVG